MIQHPHFVPALRLPIEQTEETCCLWAQWGHFELLDGTIERPPLLMGFGPLYQLQADDLCCDCAGILETLQHIFHWQQEHYIL